MSEHTQPSVLSLGDNDDRRYQPKKPFLDTTLNLGTLLQLLVLLGTIIWLLAAFDRRTTMLEMQVVEQSRSLEQLQRQINRLEHYLSSNDSQYWRKANDNGDTQDDERRRR